MYSRLVWTCLLALAFPLQAANAETAADFNKSGVAHYNERNWVEAVASFEQAYALADDSATVRHNLCNAYRAYANDLAKEADYASAAAQLERAIAVAPEDPLPLIQLGSYLLRLDMAQDAVFRLEEAVSLDPENLDGHEVLGDAYYKANNLPSAIAEWELVLAREPSRPGLRPKLDKAIREDSVEYDYGESRSRHFSVSYAPGTPSSDHNQVLTLLEGAYRDIGYRFGGIFPPGPVQVIVYSADEFAKATQMGEYVGALYDGKVRVPLRDRKGRLLEEQELRRRLYHEYVHVVVRFLVKDNVSWWLNEGLAEVFSREATTQDAEMLLDAYKKGTLFNLSQLTEPQLDRLSPDELRLAYCQARATVDFMWTRFGKRCLTSLMESLAAGVPEEKALHQVYRRNYVMMERDVAYQISRAGK